ncbi:unnamed protein product [Moneuplotes crassus]|uniref:Uncharacterized protein n=1 Tax=Euplotes crassus TaxID=5936 RepID=A0AAD1X776_EUPCR|nr:unnamed protein product [Moneuplotes crassus]
MSVYNGFVSRAIETSYMKALYNMTFLLQLQLTKFLQKDTPIREENFKQHFEKLYQKIVALDNKKYQPPKYSYSLKNLAKHFKVYQPDAIEPIPSTKNSFSSSFSKLNQTESFPSHRLSLDPNKYSKLSPVRKEKNRNSKSSKRYRHEAPKMYKNDGSKKVSISQEISQFLKKNSKIGCGSMSPANQNSQGKGNIKRGCNLILLNSSNERPIKTQHNPRRKNRPQKLNKTASNAKRIETPLRLESHPFRVSREFLNLSSNFDPPVLPLHTVTKKRKIKHPNRQNFKGQGESSQLRKNLALDSSFGGINQNFMTTGVQKIDILVNVLKRDMMLNQ